MIEIGSYPCMILKNFLPKPAFTHKQKNMLCYNMQSCVVDTSLYSLLLHDKYIVKLCCHYHTKCIEAGDIGVHPLGDTLVVHIPSHIAVSIKCTIYFPSILPKASRYVVDLFAFQN